MNENEIELRYIYTHESFIAASNDYAKAFPEPLYEKLRRWVFQIIFIVFGVLPGIYYIWLYIRRVPIRITQSWIFLLYGLILAIAIWDLAKWLRHRFKPQSDGFDKDDRWQGERHWIISDAGIQYEVPTQQSNYKWAAFNKVIETSSAYLFSSGIKDDLEWFYMPKYAFESKEKEELFKTIAKRNINFQELK